MTLPAWTSALLRLYCKPQKRALADCVRDLRDYPSLLPQGVAAPSYDQARRLIDKLGVLFRNRGRLGPRQMKAMRAYVSRDTSDLWPTAVYAADGHTFDAMVRHPLTGKPFRPEITTIIDVYTRRAVGWSIGLAENTWGTLDALRNAVTTAGICDIWYVDRGKGFNNRRFDGDEEAELLGFLGRLGITKMNSLPYNSQARGVIERLHQTIWVRGAKTLVTYMGAAMDDEARQIVHKRMEAEVKEAGTTRLALPWPEFVTWCQEQVNRYNALPHSSLPKVNGRHMSPDEMWAAAEANGWRADVVSEAEAGDLFRPYETRVARRGLIELFGNQYFHRRLEQWHGIRVAVGYDIHDAGRVWVRELDDGQPGRLIAVAEWNGHKTSFVPVSVAEQAHRNRLDHQERRSMRHVEDVRDERRALDVPPPAPESAGPTDAEIEGAARLLEHMGKAIAPAHQEPVQGGTRPRFSDDYALAAWVLHHPDQATNGDRAILLDQLRSPLFRQVLKAQHGVDAATLKAAISKKPGTTESERSIAHA